jgi:murein DD-endopeptidase MepM/ murein hydrolase activator NlpD
MRIPRIHIIFLLIVICGAYLYDSKFEPPQNLGVPLKTSTPSETPHWFDGKGIDFSSTNAKYRFTANIDHPWRIEYVPATEAINIYDDSLPGSNNLEKSKIFIRYFNASEFQTLTTMNILEREPTNMNGHEAVRYEIEKKPGVANFADQPSWRSQKHSVIDIRLAQTSPSVFYVFARNPEVSERDFNTFIESILFHNDKESFAPPMQVFRDRITKKPFGIYITPGNSPVQPEQFTGFHTGIDIETGPSQALENTPVFAVCGGPVVIKRTASGYGGLVVQECLFENEPITVIYGHLRLSSVSKKVGDYMAPTTWFADLGTANSAETDGERKHLHLGIHKGRAVNIAGYVAAQSQLSNWIDPLSVLPRIYP